MFPIFGCRRIVREVQFYQGGFRARLCNTFVGCLKIQPSNILKAQLDFEDKKIEKLFIMSLLDRFVRKLILPGKIIVDRKFISESKRTIKASYKNKEWKMHQSKLFYKVV